MRIAQIRSLDISNGDGVGIAIFVQGCPEPHCKNCFNPETWDFSGGTEWTQETIKQIMKLVDKPYIKRVSLLGGEPLAEENVEGVLAFLHSLKEAFHDSKKIWLYSRYVFEYLMEGVGFDKYGPFFFLGVDKERYEILQLCDVLVDGPYVDAQKDFNLKWRGSSNQRVIDLKKTFEKGEVVLYCD